MKHTTKQMVESCWREDSLTNPSDDNNAMRGTPHVLWPVSLEKGWRSRGSTQPPTK